MRRKSMKVVDYEVSSGNVYADLGFADSAEMLLPAFFDSRRPFEPLPSSRKR